MATVVSSENVCVSPTVARLLSDLAGILGRESSPPLDEFRGELGGLQGKLEGVRAFLEDAEEKQMRNQKVKEWLRELRELACDAEDVLDSLVTEVRLEERDQVRNSDVILVPCDDIQRRQSVSVRHKLEDLLGRLDGIDKYKDELLLSREREGGGVHEGRRKTDTSRLEDAQFVVGREDDKSNVVKLLLSDDGSDGISVVPVIGMGGLGKTTLSHLVFDEVAGRFESRMWVCVTDDFDLKRILREMIKFHSKMPIDSNLSEALLESRLLEFLKGKRFLLVLDDVWPEHCRDWGKLKTLLNKGGKGSKVLITSRNERVSEIMSTQKPYSLSCLPEDKCLSLFNKIAFKGDSCFSEVRKKLEQTGMGIVKKCKGLPLAVKAMAGLLRDLEDVKKWKKILKSEIWEVEEMDRDSTRRVRVLPALQLSYNHLPSTLKQCFAYCSIFPKSFVFKKQDLVKLWMAQAFLRPIEVDKSPEEVGSEYFDELLMRSFFQISNIGDKSISIYRMHDLIHDMAVSLSKPYCFQVQGIGLITSSEASRHVSLLCRDAEQPIGEVISNSKKLRTLLFPTDDFKNFGQALDTLFHSLPYMRALDLSSSELKVLPDSIAELKLLQYLDLSKTEIRQLPDSICRLYNLETLKLLDCHWLYELPEGLADLINLCHLELDDMFWFKATRLPPRLGNLTKLQNLHSFFVGGRDQGHGIGELNRLACLDGTLHISKLENARDAAEANLKEKQNLRKVVFEWSSAGDSDNDMRILEDLQPHTNIKALQVSYYKGSAFPSWLRDGALGNLVTVTLAHCVNCKVLSLGELPQLRDLNVKGMLELEEWQGQYPFLGRLKVISCPKLRALPLIFINVTVMKIKRCHSLEALPIAPSLEFLILDSNSSLQDWQERIICLSCQEQGQVVTKKLWSYSNVLEMKIVGCPMLEGLPKMFAPQKLEIWNCELIRTLPPPQFARRLHHLALVGCDDGSLLRAIPCTTSLSSLVISGISNVSAFPEFPALPGLKALYIRDCRDLESLLSDQGESLQISVSVKLLSVQNCPSLQVLAFKAKLPELECLSIGSCPNLESLGPEGTLTGLTKLKDVYISNCPELHLLPEDGFPLSVQHLHIESSPLLTAQCNKENGGGPYWPKIKDIPDLEIFDFKAPPAPCPSTAVASLPFDSAERIPSQMSDSCDEAHTSSPLSSDLRISVRDDHFTQDTEEPGPSSSITASSSDRGSKNDGYACGSSSVEIVFNDLSLNEHVVHNPDMNSHPMTLPPDDEFENICKEIFADDVDDSTQSTSNHTTDVEIHEAYSAVRSLISLDPTTTDASHAELKSSSLSAALRVLHELDRSVGLNSHQVEGLHQLVMDWQRIATEASTARKEQQRLQEKLSGSDRLKTSLLDLNSRRKTLKTEAERLARQDKEDQLKIKELEDLLEAQKAQSSRIKSQRLTNFNQAKQLKDQLSQLRAEAPEHRRRIKEAEILLANTEQQWGAFRDTVVEVASLFD